VCCGDCAATNDKNDSKDPCTNSRSFGSDAFSKSELAGCTTLEGMHGQVGVNDVSHKSMLALFVVGVDNWQGVLVLGVHIRSSHGEENISIGVLRGVHNRSSNGEERI
jgi:hypothetical protein